MHNNLGNAAGSIPNPVDFRVWVQIALAELGLSALSVGRALDLGKNTLGDFLAKPERSIHLHTAANVANYLGTQAALAGKTLPRLGGIANG